MTTPPEQKFAAQAESMRRSNQELLLSYLPDILVQREGSLIGELYPNRYDTGGMPYEPDEPAYIPDPPYQPDIDRLEESLSQNSNAEALAASQLETSVNQYGERYNVDPHVTAFYGPPDDLTTRLIHPSEATAFLHAKPAQLSLLQPLLKFFMVDETGAEEEIFFSDYMTEEKSLELASLRRSGTAYETLTPRSQKGVNVGIKSFNWDYHNKHEGDRIIRAKLELYFGSLAELVNVNYLQFLFTNGRKDPMYPPLRGKAAAKAAYQRSVMLGERVERRTKQLQDAMQKDAEQENIGILDLEFGADRTDYRQLKVAVGWSVPKGSQQKLLRMFAGSSKDRRTKLDGFLAAVQRTQRIIHLGLVDYEVDFSQEGPTTLSLTYLGSVDNYLASNTSDIFGQFNQGLMYTSDIVSFAQNELPEALLRKLTQDPIGTGLWPEGYAYERTRKWRNLTKEESQKHPPEIALSYTGLMVEKEILEDRWRIARYRDSLPGFKGEYYEGGQHWGHNMAEISQQIETVEELIEYYLKRTEPKRFASPQKGDFDLDRETVDTTPQGVNVRKILFIRLGDILKGACTLAGLRKDIKLICGSVDMYALGLLAQGSSGGSAQSSAQRWLSIYDIPISIEYYMQFFYEKVIAKGRTTYPMRSFINDIMSLVGALMNHVTRYSLKTRFDQTVYSSYQLVADRILTPQSVLKYQQRQGSVIYKPKKQSLHNHYIIFAHQMDTARRYGNKDMDEADGIYHYVLAADRGLARDFNFSKIEMPQYQALQIEAANYGESRLQRGIAAGRALILPQNIQIEMFGNSLHQNGDLIYVDSRAALGNFANEILSMGGYYRVVRCEHRISPGDYTTVLHCMFELPTGRPPVNNQEAENPG
jgi:hypothetical protein